MEKLRKIESKRNNPMYEDGSKSFELGRFFAIEHNFISRHSFLDLDILFCIVSHADDSARFVKKSKIPAEK